jgi:undecaprenyl diphosphate synthase
MDGNGRWARRRGEERCHGHELGANALRRITRRCRSIGIREVTFFALSTENFVRRPAREVKFLTWLLKSYLISERAELLDNDIRLKSIGHTDAFPEEVRAELAETKRLTADRTGMVLRLALNYGGRQEILDAALRLGRDLLAGRLMPEEAEAFGEQDFRRFLSDAEMSDPDLLIRTGGESRLSNFLLWHTSYSEMWVTETLWPDFDVPDLDEALRHYASRERRYGAVGPLGAPGAADLFGPEESVADTGSGKSGK